MIYWKDTTKYPIVKCPNCGNRATIEGVSAHGEWKGILYMHCYMCPKGDWNEDWTIVSKGKDEKSK